MSYLLFTIVVLLLAASGGIFMITKVVKNERPPRAVAYIHGTIAAIGYGVFIYYSFGESQGSLKISTILLTIAILGGLALFTFDTLKKRVPKTFAIIHATAALAGIAFLILFATGN
jgi:hypothetical protein